ncbi:MAG: L,D-transpeptidase [Chlorogloeopsis fritschii C42_A2020_084]|nr:L,D-transpeptidase [Chlorogloeopsis fritschii C42_A2020_084]
MIGDWELGKLKIYQTHTFYDAKTMTKFFPRINWNRKKILTILLLSIGGCVFYLLLVKLKLMFPLTELPEVLCLQGCSARQKLHTPPAGNQLLNYDKPIEKLAGAAYDKQKFSLLIEKSKHRLTLYYELKPLKSYAVVFGGNPKGDKYREGDKKTPEGILHIRNLYSHPQWSKFLWLDYPNPDSWRKHFQAKLTGKLAWHIPIGGEIGIHGVPQGADGIVDQRTNWTLGCPSLKNKDVDELYQWVQVGTVVEIVP